jgi:hypothetical protein
MHTVISYFCGNRISPDDDTAMENLARYIIRASFSQERMRYLDEEGTVVYTSKDGATTRNFPALEWLAAMCSHIPNRGEQMVRYYGTIFSLKHTLTRSTATPNTPGMAISMHNASSEKACRGGLSGLCSKTLPCRVTWPKDGMIFQKSGRRSTALLQSHRHALFFDVK